MRNVQDKQCRQEVLDRLVALAQGVGDGTCPSHKTCTVGNKEAYAKISDVMHRMSRVVGTDITSKSRKWPLPAARGLSYMYIHLDGLPYNRQARLLDIGLSTVYHSMRLVGRLIEVHDPDLLEIIDNYEQLTSEQHEQDIPEHC